jgi:hypothetical protein
VHHNRLPGPWRHPRRDPARTAHLGVLTIRHARRTRAGSDPTLGHPMTGEHPRRSEAISRCPRRVSNPHWTGFKPAASASWATGAGSILPGTHSRAGTVGGGSPAGFGVGGPAAARNSARGSDSPGRRPRCVAPPGPSLRVADLDDLPLRDVDMPERPPQRCDDTAEVDGPGRRLGQERRVRHGGVDDDAPGVTGHTSSQAEPCVSGHGSRGHGSAVMDAGYRASRSGLGRDRVRLDEVRYHTAQSFGVRSWVSKSTCTSPRRCVYPHAHSKLSSSDQAWWPRRPRRRSLTRPAAGGRAGSRGVRCPRACPSDRSQGRRSRSRLAGS